MIGAESHHFKDFNNKLLILCWNINGVKEKFSNDAVISLFEDYDLVIVMETHFKKRHKCPENFKLVGKSKELFEKIGRGGVAVYAKVNLDLKFNIYEDVCPDALVMEIENTNITIVAPYIVPDNSKFKVKEIFSILDFIIKNFKERSLYIVGDLNARCGTPDNYHNYNYAVNPDKIINTNGKKCMCLCSDNDLVMVNGLLYKGKCFDTNYTYFRGLSKSQNDWCITNSIDSVVSFKIIPKLPVSDHTPCSLSINFTPMVSLEMLNRCAAGNLSYDSYDRSKILKAKIKLSHIEVTPHMINDFNELALQISNLLHAGECINRIARKTNDEMYAICKKYSTRKKKKIRIPENKANCTSKNFNAIAEANLKMYTICVEENRSDDEAMQYLLTWQENKTLAAISEEKEFNTKINNSWKCISKKDPRKMWKSIDYKDKESKVEKDVSVDPKIIHEYFENIFQAAHLSRNPTIDDIKNELDSYTVVNEELDQEFTYEELCQSILQIGRGIGIDGLDKDIAHLFPRQLRLSLLQLINTIYHDKYPEEWCYQILRPEVKKGHTHSNPKLRGVAISAMLASIYDIMIDGRFQPWYVINPEQAGFRELQGCLIQIFAIYLLMELARSLDQSIFIGFIDYEKAFDYVNRCDIVKDLMDEKAGSTFTKAVAEMYQKTYYVPKISENICGEPILALHGVTQGRKSSTSLFSFTMRNIPKSVNLPNSFLNGIHILQLADDSSVITDTIESLISGFSQLIDASDTKFMVTNLLKTFYLHLSNDPYKDVIELINGCTIKFAENDEHLYLGMWFTASACITAQMKCNLNHRAYNIKKFYDWLDVNQMTPIIINY